MQYSEKGGHQLRNVAKLAPLLLHIERATEAEISKNVEDQIIRPVSHVKRSRPRLIATACIFDDLAVQELAPSVNIGVYKWFCVLQGFVGEAGVKDTPFASVNGLVGRVPRGHRINATRVGPIVV